MSASRLTGEQLADRSYDIVIVGSGMGGGTLAYVLRDSGAQILLVERGDFIPSEPENWSVDAVFSDGRYKAKDRWQAADGRWYEPGLTYAVGGNTKVFGAALPRFRPSDFGEVQHADGMSPAWPFTYEEIEPFYAAAEQLFGVHGEIELGQEGARRDDFPFPPVPDEPPISELRNRLRESGYTPSYIPLGIDLRPGGRCVRVATCDGFVCKLDAKADADIRCVRPALKSGTVDILTRAYARRILSRAGGGRATGIEVEVDGQVQTIHAGLVVVSCGAVNSAALLLRSETSGGRSLANSSRTVGRHYMVHNNSIMLAVRPVSRNKVVFQKTLYVNDFYDRGTDDHPYPLGHIQLIGKVRAQMTRAQAPWAPAWARRYVTDRSTDWWLFTEDLPDPENRVEITDGGAIRVHWKANNVRAHDVLVREARKMVRAGGYPLTFSRKTGIEVCSHQAGTVRAGVDGTTSALDPTCRAHDVDNLYVVDASFFPSLPVMNPALTIAANALRVGQHILARSRQSQGLV
jgi:choline dehydrogenase-like flavoprotein